MESRFVNIQNPEDKKIQKKVQIIQVPVCRNTLYQVIHSICVLISIYFSFKRNNGFSLGSFMVAITFPQIYILYVLGTEQNLGSLRPGSPVNFA